MLLDFDQQFATAPVALALEVDVPRMPEVVWQHVIAVERWRTWYRGVESAHVRGGGPLVMGSRLDWRVDGWRTRSIVVEVEAPLRLAWTLQTLGGQGALRWTFTPTASGGCCVRLEEWWKGMAVSLLRRTLRQTLRVSRAAWLEGLVAAS
jgi:hypothetical protein